jgi:GT2 family glycosyltransferase
MNQPPRQPPKLPKVSVIVPTYGREQVLCQSIADVLAQDYPDFETIVVDQTPQHLPETETQLSRWADAGQIQWHRLRWASLPGARNFAARRSSGEILIFIDDDVRLEPGFIAAHVANYRNPEIGAVAGRVFDRMKLEQECTKHLSEFDYQVPEAADPAIAWYHIDLVRATQPQAVITARGCNMSFRRQLFTQAGLHFDERYRGSAVREESDFCLSLRKTGLKIWYDPAAHLVHLGEESGGCHDISTRSIGYQTTFYHNHFWLSFKHLTWGQRLRFCIKLFDCHVLGHPPCYKSGSPIKVLVRFGCYWMGFAKALSTAVVGLWDDGQIYSRRDPSFAPRS